MSIGTLNKNQTFFPLFLIISAISPTFLIPDTSPIGIHIAKDPLRSYITLLGCLIVPSNCPS